MVSRKRIPKRARKPGGFDYPLDFKTIDFRRRPDLHRIGKGEQGALLVEPYNNKSELLLGANTRPSRPNQIVSTRVRLAIAGVR
jgi:Domain of unknown function (DUF4385)